MHHMRKIQENKPSHEHFASVASNQHQLCKSHLIQTKAYLVIIELEYVLSFFRIHDSHVPLPVFNLSHMNVNFIVKLYEGSAAQDK